MPYEEVRLEDKFASLEVRCHRGHVTSVGLWNCPTCTDPAMDIVRQLVPMLERYALNSNAGIDHAIIAKAAELLLVVPR
jgi:hypothetical protein